MHQVVPQFAGQPAGQLFWWSPSPGAAWLTIVYIVGRDVASRHQCQDAGEAVSEAVNLGVCSKRQREQHDRVCRDKQGHPGSQTQSGGCHVTA